ncbi:ParB/RepB/Spo0J family partition protein [Sorangium sp. So ce119]|uniref:ParB/RepB/Spo0J family partition protein n=1 Tax=Sorangium sp. So ce119 TaxID=3133279 RepID=UPI003F60E932
MTNSTSDPPREPLLLKSSRIIFEVPVERLVPSPTQPRTRSRDGADLVDSIREHGVIEPLWIRRSVDDDTYEIIFGERRWNGSKLAGLATVPAELRDDLTTEEIVVLQDIENGQREDVSPLDEARSYRLLQQRFGRATHEVARMVHKPEARVLRRLKLLALPECAQRALDDGSLPLRSAEALARIQHPDDREAASRRVIASEMSPALVTRMVEHEYMLRLADAQFDREDARLVPDAGPCSRCPKRSGAQMLLYADAGEEEDRCSDRDCFEAKKRAHWEREAAAATARGVRVVDGQEAAKLFPHGGHGGMSGKAAQDFVELDHPCYMVAPAPVSAGDDREDGDDGLVDEEPSRAPTWREVLGRQAGPALLVRDPGGRVHELVPREAAVQALAGTGKLPSPAPEPRVAPNAGRATEEARIARAAQESAYENSLAAIAAKAAETKPSLSFWRFLVALLLEVLDTWQLGLEDVIQRRKIDQRDDEGEVEALLRYVASAKEPEARGLVIELLVSGRDFAHDCEGCSLDIAARFYGVDLKKIHTTALRKAREAAAKEARTEKPTGRKKGPRGSARSAAAAAPPTPPAKAAADARACVVCGCTDDAACDGGCSWVDETRCSSCAALQERILEVLGERPMTREDLRAGLEAEEQPFAQRVHAASDDLITRRLVRARDGKLDLVQRRLFTGPAKGRSRGALTHAEAT